MKFRIIRIVAASLALALVAAVLKAEEPMGLTAESLRPLAEHTTPDALLYAVHVHPHCLVEPGQVEEQVQEMLLEREVVPIAEIDSSWRELHLRVSVDHCLPSSSSGWFHALTTVEFISGGGTLWSMRIGEYELLVYVNKDTIREILENQINFSIGLFKVAHE